MKQPWEEPPETQELHCSHCHHLWSATIHIAAQTSCKGLLNRIVSCKCNFYHNNEYETDVWSTKGQSVYWFSAFTPGGTSLSSEVTVLATVTTWAERRTRAEPGEGWSSNISHSSLGLTKVVVLMTENSAWPAHRRLRFTLVFFSPPKNKHVVWINSSSSWTLHLNLWTVLIKKEWIQTHKHLIQDKLGICRQYCQFKGNNINSSQQRNMALSFFIRIKNLKWWLTFDLSTLILK